MANVLFVVVVMTCILGMSLSQIPIPKKQLGYVYNGGSNDAQVHLDIHMGPVCPDSRDAFPVAKQVADNYGASTVKLTLHMFPLPFHFQSYLTAIGAHVVKNIKNDTGAYIWFKTIYDNIDKLGNTATSGYNHSGVVNILATYAQQVGIDLLWFKHMIESEDMESLARDAWKYSCSRAVSGTPTYFLNDVPIAASPSWSLADWKTVIDPLLQKQSLGNTTCPLLQKRCEYLPGKIECCHDAEACIPNVGCRCFKDGGCIEKTTKDCPSDTKYCQFLPGKVECCTKGEACIPNVGCRCFDEKTKKSNSLTKMMKIKPIA